MLFTMYEDVSSRKCFAPKLVRPRCLVPTSDSSPAMEKIKSIFHLKHQNCYNNEFYNLNHICLGANKFQGEMEMRLSRLRYDT